MRTKPIVRRSHTRCSDTLELKMAYTYVSRESIPSYFEVEDCPYFNNKTDDFYARYGSQFPENTIYSPFIDIYLRLRSLIYLDYHYREDEVPERIKTLKKQLDILTRLQALPKYTRVDIDALHSEPCWYNYFGDSMQGHKFQTIFECLNASQHYAETAEIPLVIEQMFFISRKKFTLEQTQAYLDYLRVMTLECMHDLIEHALSNFEQIFPDVDFNQAGIVDTRASKIPSARRVRFFEPSKDDVDVENTAPASEREDAEIAAASSATRLKKDF